MSGSDLVVCVGRQTHTQTQLRMAAIEKNTLCNERAMSNNPSKVRLAAGCFKAHAGIGYGLKLRSGHQEEKRGFTI